MIFQKEIALKDGTPCLRCAVGRKRMRLELD